MKPKEYVIKIYANTGDYIKTLTTGELGNIPRFSSQINGIYGPCTLLFQGDDYKFNSFDEGNSVNAMNLVDVWEFDEDNTLGRTIYRGYMSMYEPFYSRDGEGVNVTLQSRGSILNADYYRTGAGAYEVTHTDEDPETIARAVIDHYNTIFGGSLISYDNDSTDAVGVLVTKTFTDRKWIDVLQEIQEKLAGGNWWWKIDATGKYWLKDKPAAATHEFTMGLDIDDIRAPKSAENICNQIQVRRTGGDVTDYSDATSQETYGFGDPATGRWADVMSDSGIGNEGTADQSGEGRIARDKDSKTRPRIIINNNYDIESILVGQTCKIKNLPLTNGFFNDNMLIVGVQYDGDTATVEIGEATMGLNRQLETFVYPNGR